MQGIEQPIIRTTCAQPRNGKMPRRMKNYGYQSMTTHTLYKYQDSDPDVIDLEGELSVDP